MSGELSSYAKALLEAESLAIVGASANPVKIGGRPLHYLMKEGFRGKVYPVNPNYEELMGVRCYPDLMSIKEPVDLVILAVGAANVEAELRKCADKKAKAVVVFSSGFAEVGEEGRKAQNRLKEICERHGMALLGPNSLGMINCRTGLIASFTTFFENRNLIPGELGFVSQSGAMGAYFLDMLAENGLGCSKWITTGNEALLNTTHFLEYFVDDDETKVIAMYLEDIKDGPRFRRAALRAAEKGKPIVAIKAGQSEAGARAAASHTGAMAGEDANYQAVFDQLGIIRVHSLSEMLTACKLLLHQGPVTGNRIAILSVSGGAGVIMADEASKRGLEVPPFAESTVRGLREALPSYAAVQNPMDVTGSVLGQTSTFRKALAVLKEDTSFDTLVIFIGLMHSIENDFLAALREEDVLSRKKMAVVWIGATDKAKKGLESIGIPVFDDIPQAITAIAHSYASSVRRASILLDSVYRQAVEAEPAASKEAAGAASGPASGGQALTEHQTKALLKPYGLPCPRERLATSAKEALSFVRNGELAFPLALKLQSPQVLHKSDAGAVLLKIAGEEELERGVERLLELGRTLKVPVEGVLVQEMVEFDHELIVGIRHDPIWGPILVVGRGGVFVEVMKDFVSMGVPVSAYYIAEKLGQLKSANMFRGYRGKKPVDLHKVAAVIAGICQGYLDHRDRIRELEINPLVIRSETGDIWALDGLALP